MTGRFLLAAALTVLILPGASTAQERRTLNKPDATFEEPFTLLRGVHELPDGRVVVSDMSDKIVQAIDFRTGRATAVGREGSGPGEWALPGGLFGLPDGSALLQDMGNRRFLTIGKDASVGAIVTPPEPPPPEARGGGAAFSFSSMLIDVRGVDARGRLYFQGSPLSLGESDGPDSLPVFRWDRANPGMDTVAWIPLSEDMRPRISTGGSGGNRNVSIRIGGGKAWPSQVGWGVAANGAVAIVTPEPFQTRWVNAGRTAAGPVVTYTPVRVTQAEKDRYAEEQRRQRPIMFSVRDGGGGNRTTASAPSRSSSDEVVFPETMPPFTGRFAVLVTPEGEVWVQRTRKASEKTPIYDVFDATGKITATVSLQPNSTVLGFGKGTVYVVRMDEDDLQYLERYRR